MQSEILQEEPKEKTAGKKMLRDGKITVDEIAGYFTDLSTRDIWEIEKELFQTI